VQHSSRQQILCSLAVEYLVLGYLIEVRRWGAQMTM
jgi:hypothetical protein